ncbi:MAG: hypothetical protein MMC33_010011, partial [Icmadophila ericetorum]|nr:hypothetical protein [Icmadophila ericetorum]
ERGLATRLLRESEHGLDDMYGIATSHAAACLALAKSYGRGIQDVNPTFISTHMREIIECSPIDYIHEARLHGSLFDSGIIDGAVSCINTGFFVDHTEPLEALCVAKAHCNWPLGELPEGMEFVLIVAAKRRSRSKSSSLSPMHQETAKPADDGFVNLPSQSIDSDKVNSPAPQKTPLSKFPPPSSHG